MLKPGPMSPKTHLNLICAVIALCLFSAPLAKSDGPDDARGDLNKSMNDFYDKFKASQDKSPTSAKKIQSDTILPAEQGVSKALVEKGTKGAPPESGSKGPSARTSGSNGRKKGRGSPSESSDEQVSEPVDNTPVDGSKVPDLLEFPGAPKTPAPQAKPQQPKSP